MTKGVKVAVILDLQNVFSSLHNCPKLKMGGGCLVFITMLSTS